MNEAELANLKLIRDIVDNPLFNTLVNNMKRDIADTMLVTEKEEARDRLYSEAKAIDRLAGELVAAANRYRMIVNA
jgi:hypothetical protein